MFLHIEHVSSGETLHLRRLSDDETLDPTVLTDAWLQSTYDGELTRDEPNGHIPSGCADYRTEIRLKKHNDVVIWIGLDWFGSV